ERVPPIPRSAHPRSVAYPHRTTPREQSPLIMATASLIRPLSDGSEERTRTSVKCGSSGARSSVWFLAVLWAAVLMSVGAAPAAAADSSTKDRVTVPEPAIAPAAVVHVNGRDLQQVIDESPSRSTILCDPNHPITLSTPVRIDKPLTIRGLCARLPERLGKTSLLIITAPGVTI